jgi:hypothetical protein
MFAINYESLFVPTSIFSRYPQVQLVSYNEAQHSAAAILFVMFAITLCFRRWLNSDLDNPPHMVPDESDSVFNVPSRAQSVGKVPNRSWFDRGVR